MDGLVFTRYRNILTESFSDTYMICQLPTLLLPTAGRTPADYESRDPKENEGGRPSEIDDVIDFILEYINYDVSSLILY